MIAHFRLPEKFFLTIVSGVIGLIVGYLSDFLVVIFFLVKYQERTPDYHHIHSGYANWLLWRTWFLIMPFLGLFVGISQTWRALSVKQNEH